MTRPGVGELLAIAVGVVAQALLGWWALAMVGFVAGVIHRRISRVAVRFGVGIALAGGGWLAWLAWTGKPIGALRTMLVELTGLPIVTLSLLLPALIGCAGAYLGAVAGRKLLFG